MSTNFFSLYRLGWWSGGLDNLFMGWAGVSTSLFSTMAIALAGGVSEGLDSLSISWAGVSTSLFTTMSIGLVVLGGLASLSKSWAGVSTSLFSTMTIDLAGGVSVGFDSLSKLGWCANKLVHYYVYRLGGVKRLGCLSISWAGVSTSYFTTMSIGLVVLRGLDVYL